MTNFGALVSLSGAGRAPAHAGQAALSVAAPRMGFNPDLVRAPKLTLASVLLDTSESMLYFDDARTRERCSWPGAVIECYNKLRDELVRGQTERNRVALGCFGFDGVIEPWALAAESPLLDTRRYAPCGNSPLCDRCAELFRLGKYKQEEVQAPPRNIRCTMVYLIVTDGAECEHSVHSTEADVRREAAAVLSEQGNFIFGVGVGTQAAARLRAMGIPAEFVRDVRDKLGLAAVFREFSTLTTTNRIVPRAGSFGSVRRY